jgi:hypothetical protein
MNELTDLLTLISKPSFGQRTSSMILVGGREVVEWLVGVTAPCYCSDCLVLSHGIHLQEMRRSTKYSD